MHDPLIVAFDIPRPWPAHHTLVGGGHRPRRRYWPSMITIWHREPGGHDSGTICRQFTADHRPKRTWRWHVWHWRVQIAPLQRLRRTLLTRCEHCGGRSTKTNPVNVAYGWSDGPHGPWWRGERGLTHHGCYGLGPAEALRREDA